MSRRTGWTRDLEQFVASDTEAVYPSINCDQAANPSGGQDPMARRDRPMTGLRGQCPAEQAVEPSPVMVDI